jgi:hypothetical protein
MTPKEKAINLVHKFCSTTDGYYKSKKNLKNAKQCALIAVDEILKLVSDDLDLYYKDCIYWEQVKAEIQAL